MTGEKWWHLAIADILTGGLVSSMSATLPFSPDPVSSAITAWGAGYIDGGFAEADRRAVNSWKITGGMFLADDEYGGSDANEVWQVVSRFTWQMPMPFIGSMLAQGYNIFGRVDVEYFDGATVIYDHDFGSGSAFSAGGYLFMDRYQYYNGEQTSTKRVNDYSNSMLVHEYGHYAQTRDWGGIIMLYPSLTSLANATVNGPDVHNKLWVERDANARALNYFEGRKGFEVGKTNYNIFSTYCGAENIQFYDNRYLRWWYLLFPDPIFITYYNVNNNPR